MSITEIQKLVDDWIKQYGVRYFDVMTNTLLLNEEVGELSRLIARKYGDQSFKTKELADRVDTDISDEIGDIIFVLICLANQMDLSLEEIIESNLIKKTNRDHARHKSNKKLKK
jgi:NTP pyrophosphatase (non-canonical NTP hydrolase)